MKKSPEEIKKIEQKHTISKEFMDLVRKLSKEHGKDAVMEGLCSYLATHSLVEKKPDQYIMNFMKLLKKEYETSAYHFKKVFGGL